MPAKKSKSKTVKSKPGFKLNWKSASLILASALVGSYAIASFAATDTAQPIKRKKGNLSISYIKEQPTVAQLNGSAPATYTQRSRQVEVSSGGVVYCTPQNGAAITKRQLSSAEMKSVRASVKATNIESQGDDIAKDATTLVNSYRGITINNGSTTKRTYVYDPSLETASFKQAATILEGLCTGATQQIQEKEVPILTPTQGSVDTTQSKSHSIFEAVSTAITPKVSALVCDANCDPAAELDQFIRIGNARGASGVQGLSRLICLDDMARDRAKDMAANGALKHTADLGGTIAFYCGGNWTPYAGENVGIAVTSEGVFNAFMNSPGHRVNILKPEYTNVGVGMYHGPNGQLWTAQVFINCSNGRCPANTGFTAPWSSH